MSSSVPATKITTRRGSVDDEAAIDKRSMYKFIITPIIFISFLVSLAWIDFRYTLRRPSGTARGSAGYYHSYQAKLAKLEMADALGIRSYVALVMLAVAVVIGWGGWEAVKAIWYWSASRTTT
ncbi:hypothetical protein SODALDRAFT_325492 [Sodiomyces alkalinus F11]|uniref:Uncharacterized protein n=1 Tax=Sodiomyces alkalinus (strain CBS 110278 / VKM F-3762 / F11) TaxID=1314773 RepID=A0A3N2PQZ0_SODAK|nr:hypothetical protein SODALDRAFT_325492 [Sodiomyces alkalinus F11]ROT36929.1 hypothetical protein SODALDRAFT_325492 [Sodiomyces alkalinus F11]